MKEIKKLGFGLMRLPRIGDKIDVEQTKEMVDLFMKEGFTYFDTAWAYTGSEEAIKEALVNRYPRESFQLATKNAAWIRCKSREEAISQFDVSLERTGAGYFDYYLLHNLGNERTQVFEDYDLWNWAKDLKKQGKIKHLGFSFHSTPEELEDILKKHPEAEFVQLQINYADWDNPDIQSRACYEVARKYNKPVIVMEPVKGGLLSSPPDSVQKVLKSGNPRFSMASWAIKFAANLEGVMVVLSGMSSFEQMKDNLSYMKDFKGLTKEEETILLKAQEELKKIPLIPCTKCNYCAKVCPMNIGISGSFTAMNHYKLYHDLEKAKSQEERLVQSNGKNPSSSCIECGTCEGVCPQHISIREELKSVSKLFGN